MKSFQNEPSQASRDPNCSLRLYLTAFITAVVVILLSLLATEALERSGGTSISWRASTSFIAVTLALISYLAARESKILGHSWIFGVTLFGAALALLAMTAVFLEHASHAFRPSAANTVEVTKILVSGEYDAQIFETLNAIKVDARVFFMMDGHLDVWVYILSKVGVYAIPYELMGVQERGIVFLYALVMHAMGGFNTYYMVLTNWLAHVLATIILYAVSKSAFGMKAAAIATVLYLVFPENIYWGGMIYKDEIVVLTVLASVYSLLKIVQERRHSYYLMFAVAIVGMAFLRSGLVLVILCAGLLTHATSGTTRLKNVGQYIALIVATVSGAVFLLPPSITSDLQQKIFQKSYEKLARGSSAYLDTPSISYRTTKSESLVERVGGGDLNVEKIYFVPIRIGSYLISPFPPTSMQFQGDRYILSSTYLITILLTFFAVGMYRSLITGGIAVNIMTTQFILLGLAIAFAGPFVYDRYRLLLTPFFLSIASTVLVTSSWRQRIMMMSLSGGIWAIAYALWMILR